MAVYEARPPRHTGASFSLRPVIIEGGSSWMGASLFTCPTTKMLVQHWRDDDSDVPETEFRGIVCPACTRLHFINPKTGKLLGEKPRS